MLSIDSDRPASPERTRLAWVLGGGSGIGRAIALELGGRGYRVAVSGRRVAPLKQAVKELEAAGGQGWAVPVDVTDNASVTEAHAQIDEQVGRIDTLVCSAGTNVRNRWWSDLTSDAFGRVVETNLTAVARVVLAVLPGFRSRGFGQIVVISSWSGWNYMSAAGAAYGASKTALSPLVEALNDQEGRYGVRATHLCPGEVNTEILQTRPVPPPAAELERMLQPAQVAGVVGSIVDLPAGICVNELVLTPTWNRMYIDSSAVPATAR